MSITINALPVSGAFVSIPGLAAELGSTQEQVMKAFAKANVVLEYNGVEAYAPLDHERVAKLVHDAGLGQRELHTVGDAATRLKVKTAAVHAAMAGREHLFATRYLEPVATLEELRSSKPVVAAQVGKAPGAVAMLGAAAAKWVVPLTVGGIATYAIGARIASGIGDTLETESQRRTRRTGALVGMGAVGAATSAMLVAGSNAAMRGLPGTPPLLHTMLSRGVVGIGLGAAALGAFGIKSHMSNDPAQAETAS